MRSLNADLVAEILKEVTSTFVLIQLNLEDTYYYTDRDVSIFYDGHEYTPLGFSFSNLVYAANMSVDRVTTDFDNVTLGLSAMLLGEDVRNKTSVISFGCIGENIIQWDEDVVWSSDIDTAVWYKNTNYIIDVIDIFRGIIGDWELSELQARITHVNEFILWKKKTLRICQASCRWTFKGSECGYSGVETWCDQSYVRCVNLANKSNFGGFRYLPAISERTLWWGRSRGAI